MKLYQTSACLCIVIASLASGVGRAQSTILTNGSFENVFGGWSLYYDGGVNYAYTWANSNSFGGTPVPDGNYFLAFDQHDGRFSQYFPVASHAAYLLTFSAICFDGTNSLDFLLGGMINLYQYHCLFTNTPPVGGPYNHTWQDFSFVFESDISPYMTLQFNFTRQFIGGQGSGGIDNISIVQIVPEPSTLALLGLAALGGFVVRQRAKRLKT